MIYEDAPVLSAPRPASLPASTKAPAVSISAASAPRAASGGRPAGNRGSLSTLFPYRRFLLSPSPLVFPKAGVRRWPAGEQPEKGGLFGSFFTNP